MKRKNYLTIDIGASSGRGSVIKFSGEKFELVQSHKFENSPISVQGLVYWNVLGILKEIKTGILKALSEFSDIKSMGIDTLGCAFGFIDVNGRLIANPVHFRVKSFNEVINRFFKIIPKRRLLELTGGIFHPGMSVFRIYMLKEMKATEFLNADKLLMLPDIFNYFLTNISTSEYTIATTTLLLNLKEKKWQTEILKKLGIPERILPVFNYPGKKIGNLSFEVCNELNIKPINVISVASHDTASAVTGIPAVKQKNWAFISMGTWCVLGIETDEPVFNENAFINGFGNEGGSFYKNLFAKNITGLWLLQECRRKWNEETGRNISFDELNDLMNNVKSFISFINVNNSIFTDSINDLPKVIRNYCRDTGQRIPQSIGEITRSILESLIMSFKYNILLLEDIINEKIEKIYLSGGGTKNIFFNQWIADSTGCVVITGFSECTTVGNFILQLKSDKEINTLEEGRELSLNSTHLSCYYPSSSEIWLEAFDRYLNLIRNEKIINNIVMEHY